MIKKRMTISILRTIAKKGFYADLIADDLIKEGVVIPVRCKDCKYYGITGDQSCEVHSSTMLEDDYHIVTMEPDDFCSYGERKEE